MKRLILLLPAAGLIWFCIPARIGILNIGNLLGIGLCVFLILWGLFLSPLKKWAERSGHAKGLRTVTRVLASFLAAGLLWTAILSIQMAVACAAKPPANTPAVVLGSQVQGTNPSLDLWARIRAAEQYLKENPQAVCIASGGQGPGEQISEAVAIRDNLIKRGIEPERIFLEDQSRSTEENIRFSKEILMQKGLGTDIAVVTDEYHQLRSSWLAKQQNLTPYAVNANTPWYIFSAMYARELLALTAASLPFPVR